jgi:tRNA threonylcarbamoyladenosine biosynthesis protein TsaB
MLVMLVLLAQCNSIVAWKCVIKPLYVFTVAFVLGSGKIVRTPKKKQQQRLSDMKSTSPTLLALETATDYCSVAVKVQDQIFSQVIQCHNQHAAKILTMIDDVLNDAHINIQQLDAIAFGAGPGSFTGVRIATSVAQGIAFGITKPVIPISTLQIIAQHAYQQFHIERALVALDARMQQIYCGEYVLDKDGLMQLYGTQSVMDPAKVILSQEMQTNGCGVGNGWFVYGELLQQATGFSIERIHADVAPLASAALAIATMDFLQGRVIEAAHALPVYLRDNVAYPSSP